MMTYTEVIDIHNNNNNNNYDESITIEDEEKIHGNVDMDSDSQKGKTDEADKYRPGDFVLNSHTSSDVGKKSLPIPPPVSKMATKRKSKINSSRQAVPPVPAHTFVSSMCTCVNITEVMC